ncbi:MAG: DMT family transporter [Pseudomonadota bacterium]
MALSSTPTLKADPGDTTIGGLDLGLYAITVFVWGTSWIALKLQLGVVAPEVSLAWRFGLAALIMAAILSIRRKPWRFAWRQHLRFAGMGACLFSLNFIFFYYAGTWLASGLLAVVFSLAALINLLIAAGLQGRVPSLRNLVAAVMGFAGVACLFWPEIVDTDMDLQALIGLLLCIAGTCFFCLGNLLSAGAQARGLPVLSANAWGMAYGCGLMALVSLVRGQPFILEPTVAYLGSLVYLAVFASVIAFASYLTLLGRIGAGRAGYATVLFPLVALAISSIFEGYSWTWIAAFGVALALGGNLLILTGRRRI